MLGPDTDSTAVAVCDDRGLTLPRSRNTGVITQVVANVRTVASKWKVVVADALTRKVLRSCVETSDILEHNVTIVEMLELNRQPFPDMDCVYIIAPTPESVDLLINDYTKGKPPYAAVHLFFIAALSDTLFEKIQKSPIQKHVQTFKELNMDFLAIEPQAFSLDLPASLHALINAATPSHLKYELTPIAKRLVSVLASLGEYPYIRYYTPPGGTLAPVSSTGGTPLMEMFARMVEDQMDELARVDKSFRPPSQRGYLLLVDRGVDVVAPLVHEYTYQAMVQDYLQLEEGCKIVNKHDDNKLATLDEKDKIWVSQKYEHIANVLEFIATGVRKFTSENKAANFASGNARGGDQIAAMKETLGALPEFQEMKSKFSLHSDMCQEMMAILAKYAHQSLSNLEQDLATASDSDFRPLKNSQAAVEALLSSKTVCHEDKIRLLMLHIVTAEGLPDEQRQHLFDLVRLSRDEYQAVTNLAVLGVKLSESMARRGEGNGNPYALGSLKAGRGRVKTVEFENSRYIPAVKVMMEDQIKGTLDPVVFPWIKEPPPASSKIGMSTIGRGGSANGHAGDDDLPATGVQKTKPSWATARAAAANRTPATAASASSGSGLPGSKRPVLDPAVLKSNGPRVILFVLGGMTFSEMRAANEVMVENRREVLIGSTHTINPHIFLDTLKTLHKARPPTLNSPFPYDSKPASPPREKVSSGSRGKSKDRNRSESERDRSRRGGDEDHPDARSKSRRDEERDEVPRRGAAPSSGRSQSSRGGTPRGEANDRDRRGASGRDVSRAGSVREDDRGGSRNGSYRDDDRGGSRNGYRDDDRGGSRNGYRDDDRGGSRNGSYRDDDRYDSRGAPSSSSRPPRAEPSRAKSRDERGGGTSRGARRDDISDRMQNVTLEQPEKLKKKGWFGF
ncbi:Sec1-like protein [Chytriomyces sp. MP71]|nr:Sec1-like protein [Chytriomyces sp. MP71]